MVFGETKHHSPARKIFLAMTLLKKNFSLNHPFLFLYFGLLLERLRRDLNLELDLNYYDKILGGMAASLLGGASAGVLTGVPLPHAIGGGALIAIVLMYHGMFRNGPE